MSEPIYTAILWNKENDHNSIDPLESSNEDLTYWMDKVNDYSPNYERTLRLNTGEYMSICYGDIEPEELWNGAYPVEEAYVSKHWSDKRDSEIAARLLGVNANQVLVKRM